MDIQPMNAKISVQPAIGKRKKTLNKILEHKYLYLMLIPALVWLVTICYAPMFGLYMAFINYMPDGKPFFVSFFSSEFVGLKWFEYFIFQSGDFYKVMRNTLGTSIITLIFSFPAPIIIAISLNEVKNGLFKRTVQTVSYLPYFISWVITANIFLSLLTSDGVVNKLIMTLGITNEPILFFQQPKLFWWIIAFANLWKNMGYNAIMYLAAISSINPELYESALVDGANRWQQTIRITLPLLKPTIVVLLIIAVGSILNGGFEQQFLMENDVVKEYADVIDYYSYRYGLGQSMFSYGAAVGLFKSVISFVLVVIVNNISKKYNEQSLF